MIIRDHHSHHDYHDHHDDEDDEDDNDFFSLPLIRRRLVQRKEKHKFIMHARVEPLQVGEI
jgi:hypothetical protein